MQLRTGIVLLAAVCALAIAWLAKDILLVAFLGLLIGVVFSFPVKLLSRFMPRGVALLLVLLVLTGGVTAAAIFVAPSMSEQFNDLQETAPKAFKSARDWMRAQGSAGEKIQQVAGKAVNKASEVAVPALLGIVSGLTTIVLVIVLGAFFVADPEVYRKGLRSFVPKRAETEFDESWRRTGGGLRRWVGGILVSMTVMGCLAAAGLALAGVHDWLLLGLLTFFGTFVPYVGAVASAIPGLLVAASQSPKHLLFAALVYVGVHLVEGYLIQPLIMRRAVHVKPAALLITVGVMEAVFKLPGVVVATPLLVCVLALVDYLWVERSLGKEPA
jgi:predicted PurR-regulated permease PerM